MKLPALTIFTEPRPPMPGILSLAKRKILSPYKYFLKGKVTAPLKKVGGHNAVTRSLLHGLERIGSLYNYNPEEGTPIYENVINLAGVDKLKASIELKKSGVINFLLAGPNLVDHVLDQNAIVTHPVIDYFVVPSKWVKEIVLKDAPSLKDRILIWPAGIDARYWHPIKNKTSQKKVVIYRKTESWEFCDAVIKQVEAMGFQPVMVEYGNYLARHFKRKLTEASFAVFISRSESQGIALAESWAMDVPTLVFNPGNFMYRGKSECNVSACPFLTDQSGYEWNTLDELSDAMRKLVANRPSFSPRKYVLDNFTDEKCAKNLIDSIIMLKNK